MYSRQGQREGGSGGTSYPGPGLGGLDSGGPEEFRFPRRDFFFGLHRILGKKGD